MILGDNCSAHDWREFGTSLFGTSTLSRYLQYCPWCEDCISVDGHASNWRETREDNHGPFLNWVIVGGESGPGARPCNIDWIRSIRDQCRVAGAKCFVKQLGSHPRYREEKIKTQIGAMKPLRLNDKKGGDPLEWPADLRVRELPA